MNNNPNRLLGDAAHQVGNPVQRVGNFAQQVGDAADDVGNAAQRVGNAAQRVGNAAQQVGDAAERVNDAVQNVFGVVSTIFQFLNWAAPQRRRNPDVRHEAVVGELDPQVQNQQVAPVRQRPPLCSPQSLFHNRFRRGRRRISFTVSPNTTRRRKI